MIEVVLVIQTSEEIDGATVVGTKLRRLEFDTEQDFDRWFGAGWDEVLHAENLGAVGNKYGCADEVPE